MTVYTDYMGGGFGSKFGAAPGGADRGPALEASRRPAGEDVPGPGPGTSGRGQSAHGWAHIKMGANRDGKIVALIAERHGTGGVGGGADVILPYVYRVPNTAVTQSTVLTNFGNQRAMRAPRHPQSCGPLTEAAMDDLADKLGMDPLEFRLKNLPPPPDFTHPLRGGAQDRSRADRLA